MHIRDDSDDLGGFWVDAAYPKTLADRVLTLRIRRPEPARQGFMNDRPTMGVLRILLGKLPATPQRNLESPKVFRRDDQDCRNQALVQFQERFPGVLHGSSRIADHGKRAPRRSTADTRQRSHLPDDLLKE